jgi:hypothetical protein
MEADPYIDPDYLDDEAAEEEEDALDQSIQQR